MKKKKCSLCGEMTKTVVHLTEFGPEGSLVSHELCKDCGNKYMSNPESHELIKPTQALDLTSITTPEELLDFLAGVRRKKSANSQCRCGTTEEEFDESGRFGCPCCYRHFMDKMEELVFPFHKGRCHVGKKPKRGYIASLMADPVEREKILKLRYAKALELEDFVKAAEIKAELNKIKNETL